MRNSKSIVKFAIMSVTNAFYFTVPIPDGGGTCITPAGLGVRRLN